MSDWTYFRGETIAIPYFVAGDVVTIMTANADIMKVDKRGPIPPDRPISASMAMIPIDGASGWFVGLSAAQSDQLAAGLYAAQVRLVFDNGTVDLSDILFIDILEPVTEGV
ncbi:MAG: hypothetical protein J7517_09830 [Sphingobium yanoikuyae]|nr:hypothetical protein [Sphingobium yanoikuyae]